MRRAASIVNLGTNMDGLERRANFPTFSKYFHHTRSSSGLDQVKPQTWLLEHLRASSAKALGNLIDGLRAGKVRLVEKVNDDIIILE
jgi:hypothetical protein